MKKHLAILTALVATGAVLPASSAGAAEPGSESEVVKAVDEQCSLALAEQKVDAKYAAEICLVTTETSSSAPEVVETDEVPTASEVGRQASESMQRAARAGKLRSKTWDQVKYGLTYKEIHKGRFYFDGSKAWSKEMTYRGKKGFHSCGTAGSWGITVNVATVGCTAPRSGSNVVNRETYKVQALAHGSPVNWTAAMSMLLKANGSMVSRAY